MSKAQPFVCDFPVRDIEDLRARIRRTRFPDQAPGPAWSSGTDLEYMRGIARFWCDEFDWFAQQRRLNRFSQYRTMLDGVGLHFIHERAECPDAPTLLICHGWPGSIFEFLDIIPRLTHPSRYGGDPADAVHVVVPSLPGYGLSFTPGQARFGVADMAACLAGLMRDVIGCERYLVQGGDWGAFVATRMAIDHPDRVAGLHLNLLPVRRNPDQFDAATPEERKFVEDMRQWARQETGYMWIQGTRPQTLAYGLTDSPIGLAAWILEKYRAWSDCGGVLETAFARDHLLAIITLYWLTGCIGSSFWPYFDRHNGAWPLPNHAPIRTPIAYCECPAELLRPPRSIAERLFGDIRQWRTLARGGHFAALEQPEAFADDIRRFISALRTGASAHSVT